MNKTLIKALWLAAFVPLFVACSSEEDSLVPSGEPQEVQVSIDTRATTDGDTWTWENNDVIGLNVTGYNGTSTLSPFPKTKLPAETYAKRIS